MKILHIITDTNIGGAGRYLVNLVTQPAFSDMDVIIACPDGDLGDALDSISVQRIPVSGRDISFSLSFTLELFKLIKSLKPDVVHTHSCLSGRLAAKSLGVPVIYTKHGEVLDSSGNFVKRLGYKWASMLLSDRVIAISNHVAQQLIELGVNPAKITVIYNGIQISEFKPKNFDQTYNQKERDEITIGTLARLDPVKRLDVLIEAARIVVNSLPEARFVIGGAGPMEQALLQKIQDLKLETYVKMVGFVEDVPAFLAGLDIFALSSDSEGLGLAVIEAMAQGLPVVATAVGGVIEVVQDNVTGFLVPPGNPRDMAQCLVRLAIDPQMAAHMGRNGRKRVEELFDAKVMAQKTVEVYEEVVSAKS